MLALRHVLAASGRLRPMTSQADAPAPGSHDRSTPTGSLEVSAATLFEAMVAARDAQGGADPRPLEAFHRALMESTLLLPVPPGTDGEARAALERAVTDSEEVEIAVMLARDGDGSTVNVLFASPGALSAWAPIGTSSLPLPARIVFGNLAASGLPAVMDPAGPIPYRFEPDEIAALAEGRDPGSGEPLVAPTVRHLAERTAPGPRGGGAGGGAGSVACRHRRRIGLLSWRPIPTGHHISSWASPELPEPRRPSTSRRAPTSCGWRSRSWRRCARWQIPSTAARDDERQAARRARRGGGARLGSRAPRSATRSTPS